MKKILFCLFIFSSLGSAILAQNTIKGTVKDVNGDLLPSATVFVNGTQRGTTTDFDGAFTIKASEGEVLKVSFLGYETKLVTITAAKNYTIFLEESASQLDEIVIVGYGTQRKSKITSALQTVSFKDEVTQPVTNSGQLLYGRFSGVQLTQGGGTPGSDGSSITIRGIGTFGNATPLVVIDNIQYEDLSAFNNLAPTDIESITVLKDASAAAIYGARGANGVVLVSTRQGKKGKMQITYNSYYGVQEATVQPKFLGALDYATLMNEKFRNEDGPGFFPRYTPTQIDAITNGTLPDQFADTNWADLVLKTASQVSHNISFSGGNDKTTYRASLGYLEQDAIVKGKFNFERYNLSLNINSKLKKWLRLNTVTNVFWRKVKGPTGGTGAFSGDNGIIYSFQRTAPTIPAFYSNGEYGFADGAWLVNNNPSLTTQNPLRRGFLGDFESDNINISHRTGLTLNLTDNITFETSGSVNLIFTNASDFNPTARNVDFNGDLVSETLNNTLRNTTNFQHRLINENILRYNKTFNKIHSFEALAGHMINVFRADGFNASIQGFPTNNIQEFSGDAITNPNIGGSAAEDVTQSFFTRLNYDYDGKYLAGFTLRRDQSSKFGPKNQSGSFPSASLGWVVSKESFMKDIDFISSLKLRGSWGISGNDRIGRNIYDQLISTGEDYVLGNDSEVLGAAITRISNPFIRWEETEQYNIGLDLSLYRNKIEIITEFFNRNSSDILYTNFPVPNTIGVTNLAAQNAASMENSGLEMSASYRGRINDIKFSVGGNFTKFIKRSEVTGLGDGGEETIGNDNIIRVGQPFRAYYGLKAIGVFQNIDETVNAPSQFGVANTPGDLRYADVSGPNGVPDGIIDDDDRTIIGNPNPNLLFNFNASLDYKGFDFNVLMQGVSGVDRLIMGNGSRPMPDNRSNVLEYWINRWTPQNPSANLPRVGGLNNTIVSSFYIQDASYLRVKNIEIGYSLPNSVLEKLDIEKLRFYVGAQNLFTLTGLEYFDPERGTGRFSTNNAPLYKTVTLGINLKL
ncbi:MAG: SusC/RagA family TonB-linked outer membrane protein [Polaribacter sp.]